MAAGRTGFFCTPIAPCEEPLAGTGASLSTFFGSRHLEHSVSSLSLVNLHVAHLHFSSFFKFWTPIVLPGPRIWLKPMCPFLASSSSLCYQAGLCLVEAARIGTEVTLGGLPALTMRSWALPSSAIVLPFPWNDDFCIRTSCWFPF